MQQQHQNRAPAADSLTDLTGSCTLRLGSSAYLHVRHHPPPTLSRTPISTFQTPKYGIRPQARIMALPFRYAFLRRQRTPHHNQNRQTSGYAHPKYLDKHSQRFDFDLDASCVTSVTSLIRDSASGCCCFLRRANNGRSREIAPATSLRKLTLLRLVRLCVLPRNRNFFSSSRYDMTVLEPGQ